MTGCSSAGRRRAASPGAAFLLGNSYLPYRLAP